MKNTGLVLEGGGMRGLYTAGILDFFMEKNLYFPYVIGVSAGACNASSYISRQIGRSKKVNLDYIGDHRYLSYRNFIKERSLFGMKFMFEEIPNNLVPFDFSAYNKAKESFVIVATNCDTGKAEYFYNTHGHDLITELKASSSLPFLSPMVNYKGMKLLDGGISDSIPIKKSLEDGNTKNLVILTRDKNYRKEPFSGKFISKRLYKGYPKLNEAMDNRYKIYNDTLDYIDSSEGTSNLFVIRPKTKLEVGRLEKNRSKLEDLFNQGYQDAKASYEDLVKWLSE